MNEPNTEQTQPTPPPPADPTPPAGPTVEELQAKVAELQAQIAQQTPPADTPEEPGPTLEPSGASYKLDAASQVYSGLTVEMRRYEQDGLWLYGVVVEGVYLPFAQAKLGYVDLELAEAANPGHKQQIADTYRREQLGLS